MIAYSGLFLLYYSNSYHRKWLRVARIHGKIDADTRVYFCCSKECAIMKDYVETVLGPRLQGDGGWVEFHSLEGDRLTLIFRGECSKCLILNRCTDCIEQKIQTDLGKKVNVIPVRKKPFFWDKD